MERRHCPECEEDRPLVEFPPRHREPAQLESGLVYRQSRCRECDALYKLRRQFFRRLERAARRRGLKLAPRKKSSYRCIELFSWRPSDGDSAWLDGELAGFNGKLPAGRAVARHGVRLELPPLRDERQLLLFPA